MGPVRVWSTSGAGSRGCCTTNADECCHQSIALPTAGQDAVWVPDLIQYNAAEKQSSRLANTKAVVSYDGSVFWSQPGHLHSPRFLAHRLSLAGPIASLYTPQMQDYPFDSQNISFQFGSWVIRPKPCVRAKISAVRHTMLPNSLWISARLVWTPHRWTSMVNGTSGKHVPSSIR